MGKKSIFVFLGLVGVIGLVVFISTGDILNKKASIALTAVPSATVFVNGQQAGTTPYENDSLKAGEVLLKMVPENNVGLVWERTLKLTPETETFVEWEFNENQELETGKIIYLEKTGFKDRSGLIVIVEPADSMVAVDGQMYGQSPLPLEDIGSGEHKVLISAPTYKSREVLISAIDGYRIVLEIKLGKSEYELGETEDEDTPETELIDQEKVVILETPTGWLRVRSGPSTSNEEIGKADPGDEYVLLGEENDWYKIQYEEDEEGWISSQYAELLELEQEVEETEEESL